MRGPAKLQAWISYYSNPSASRSRKDHSPVLSVDDFWSSRCHIISSFATFCEEGGWHEQKPHSRKNPLKLPIARLCQPDVPSPAFTYHKLRIGAHTRMEVLALSLISCLLLGIGHLPLVVAQGPYAARISCGSTADSYAPNGFLWSKDWGYSGGSAANLTVVNHNALQLNSVRYFQPSDGAENCYNITVPVGHYLVRLFFTYGEQDNANKEPQFDVSIEGTLVYSLAQGWSAEADNNYQDSLVFINDGAATICFHSSGHGRPAVASIEVLQIFNQAYERGFNVSQDSIMRSVKRVSAGAAKSGFGSDFHADPWGGDRYWESDVSLFLPGSAVHQIYTNETIKNAAVYPNIYPVDIFQTATATDPAQSLSYTLPVEPNLQYSIWIYLAELATFAAPTDRLFDVLVNNVKVFQSVDVVALARGSFTALVMNTTVLVEGKTLTVSFNPTRGNIAVNAFEVYALVPMEAATLNTNVWALQGLKQSLGVPARLGWNGDPCVPQLHPWFGVQCTRDATSGHWIVDRLSLGSQVLPGVIGEEIGSLAGLQHLNLSNNLLRGSIPLSIGQLTSLATLDLSHNRIDGPIPASLGNLTKLQTVFLNDNLLSGEVPSSLGAGALGGANLNLTNNENLCGVGITPCGERKGGSRAGMIVGVLMGCLVAALPGYVYVKRRQNIARAQRLPRDAPYAKARTTFVRDVQLARTVLSDHFRPVYHDPTTTPSHYNTQLL